MYCFLPGPRPPAVRIAMVSLLTLGVVSSPAVAQTASAVDVCAGPAVNIPVLQPVAHAIDSSAIAAITNPLLTALTGSINANLTDALSGRPLSVSLIDQNGALVSTPSSGCSITTNGQGGIQVGGGRIDGLGGIGNPTASAGSADAIAIGNNAATAASAGGAVALGTDARANVQGGVALGQGSVASRLNATREAFTGAALRSTLGTVSVGSTGNERQITNVAGGTADTDAVNVRQLRAVQTSNMQYTDRRFEEAKQYTDQQVGSVRREARQAAALGLAASSIRFDDRPGKLSLGGGIGTWRGETATAIGLGYTLQNGLAKVNVSAANAGSHWGVAGGLSVTLN